jgi:hypothetical protein
MLSALDYDRLGKGLLVKKRNAYWYSQFPATYWLVEVPGSFQTKNTYCLKQFSSPKGDRIE